MVCVGVVLCALIAAPFLSALTWAFALAVLALPLHHRLERKVGRPGVAALLSVVIVTLLIFIPTAVIVWLVGIQANEGFERIQREITGGAVRDIAAQLPGGARLYDAIVSGDATGTSLGPAVQQQASAWLSAMAQALFQIAVALFALFFLLRDRQAVLRALRHYLPLSAAEADYLFRRVRDITHATLYGNFVCSAIQGTLGGLIFWLLGIPGVLLWGVAMAMLSLIPSSGAFFIWLPAAVILAVRGDWTRASILAAWGTVVVGTIDNLLYPYLVGREMHLHTLAVFLAVVGGLIAFGAAGLVLGPVVVAATMAMHEILQARASRTESPDRVPGAGSS